VVETAPVDDVFHRPGHPYTRALLDSIPHSGGKVKGQRLPTIAGLVPGLFEMPHGCRFADRCSKCESQCETDLPAIREFGADRNIRCHYPL